ncbi:MAG: FAD-dependent oxidoreductase [Desulfobulbaceae bacterium]|nr:FAD-dependent oxidoreductase [Desulfobulbaceae bacterium]
MKAKAIIIGSGISGLTTATLLSARGYEVTVLELRKAVGGALQRFKRQNVDFDVGFHYTGGLGKGEILTRLWHHLGIMDAIPVSPFPEKAADCVFFHDSKLRARAFFSYSRIREELFTLFPEERPAIEDFFTLMHNLGDSMACYNFRDELTPFLQSMAFPEKTTLGHYLRGTIRSPQLQAILSLPVFLHGVDPDHIGLSMHATVAHCVYSGMYSVKSGGRSIINALSAKLTSHGAAIYCNQKVNEIIIKTVEPSGSPPRMPNFMPRSSSTPDIRLISPSSPLYHASAKPIVTA